MIDGSVTTCLASTLNSLLDGLQHPLVVAGISQGAFQVLQLGVDMPEFARSLIAIVPAASCGADCQQHVTEMEALIKADPDWQGGTYVRNPAHGLDDAGRYYFPWMYSDAYMQRAGEQGAIEHGREWARQWDARSLILRYEASRTFDIGSHYAGQLQALSLS